MKSGDSYWEDSLKQFIISEVFRKEFQDEPIAPRKPAEKLPPLLETARSLEKGKNLSNSERGRLFLKQARLLANYEDDYPIQGTRIWGTPTYRDLSNPQLRSYFSWRTRVRQGDMQEGCMAYALLYLFELLNRVGTQDAEEGLRQMDSFVTAYSKLEYMLPYYYYNWRISYILYNNLPDGLLKAGVPSYEREACMDILDSAPEQSDEAIMKATVTLSGWLRRSGFYKKHTQDMNRVISRVFRRMVIRYSNRNQRDLTEQLFGPLTSDMFSLFHGALFCLPNKWQDGEHFISEKHFFYLNDGVCNEISRNESPNGQQRLDSLLKYIDSEMRKARGDKPLQTDVQKKWITRIIQEEIQALCNEKNAKKAPKLSIDYSALNRIRRDAAATQEKLRIEDETEEEAPPPAPAPPPPAAPESADGDCPLNADEQRLLRCLLYGGDTAWVQREGKILSVLLDSINEKLYDSFQDSVLEDSGVVEDYLDELKEIVKP